MDIISRLMIAMSFQQVMLKQYEVSKLTLSDKAFALELASTLTDSMRGFSK